VAYRDDRQALSLQIAELEHENKRLRNEVREADERYDRLTDQQHAERRVGTRSACVLCGGTLLPVAVFAGHDVRSPLPLKLSTLRFCSDGGGFTHSASVRSLACASCGYIQNFIDMETVE
jgi:hypothetical protein